MPDFNPRQRAFIECMVKLGNAAAAAREAGYSENTARTQGARLMANADIRAAVEERRAHIADHLGLTEQYLLEKTKDIIERTEAESPHNALKGIELVARHRGMLVDRTEHTISGDVVIELDLGEINPE